MLPGRGIYVTEVGQHQMLGRPVPEDRAPEDLFFPGPGVLWATVFPASIGGKFRKTGQSRVLFLDISGGRFLFQ